MKTSEDAHDAAIEFLSPAVSAAVLDALTEDGMKSLEPKVYVRPLDALKGKFSVDVHYGSRRQYLVTGAARLSCISSDTWDFAVTTLRGAENWRIIIAREGDNEAKRIIHSLREE